MATDKRKKLPNGLVKNPSGATNDAYLFANNPKARELQMAREKLIQVQEALEEERNKPDPRPGVIANCERIIADKKAFLKSQKQLIADKESQGR